MEQEKFDIKKFFDFSSVAFWKTAGITMKIVILVLLISLLCAGGYSVFRFFFPKEVSNVNQPTFNVAQGGTVEYSNVQNNDKNNEIGLIAGPIYYDEKVGGFAGIEFKRRF